MSGWRPRRPYARADFWRRAPTAARWMDGTGSSSGEAAAVRPSNPWGRRDLGLEVMGAFLDGARFLLCYTIIF